MQSTVSSRQIVKQTLEFDSPARTPRQIWTLPWTEEHHPAELKRIQSQFPDDIAWCPLLLKSPPPTTGDPYHVGTYVNEWGCIFENQQRGVIGEVKEPLLTAGGELERLKLPEGFLSVDVDAVNAYCRQSGLFVLSSAGTRPFERLQFLRGTENVLIDLAEERPELVGLLDQIHQFFVKELEIWAQTEVDALFFQDDWGAQNNLLISPAMWRRLFKPLYKEYVDLAHRYGKYAFMHSDGNIEKIYPDLVEIGLDAINSQLFCMDIENLGARFAGKITFWGEIDRQNILAFASRDEVTQAVRRVKNACFANGGVIAQCSFGAGDRPENVEQVFQAWNML